MDERDNEANQRRKRNVALGLVMGAVVILFFLMSIVKWGGHVGL